MNTKWGSLALEPVHVVSLWNLLYILKPGSGFGVDTNISRRKYVGFEVSWQ
jgi:hypothetical protein